MDPMSLTLNHIDFKWVEETEDPKLLKKAIKLLKDDGGFFVDLQKAIEDKLEKVDKKFRVLNQTKNERISPDEIKKQTNDILNWEKDIIKSDKILSGKTENSPDGNVGGKTASGVVNFNY